jgi:quinol monooxygenase YgiN
MTIGHDKRSPLMIIVAGNVAVEAQQRESYLADSVEIIERSREAPGCLDVTIDADLLDPGPINIFEL